MSFRCEICNRDFVTQESLNQHNQSKHTTDIKKPVNFKRYFMIIMISLIILFSVLTVSSYIKKPGNHDEFANCLTEKGVIVYGNDFCQYTIQQLNYFGKSQKYLNYVRCTDNEELCNEKDIKTTPTWEYKGEFYPQVQTFERLAAVTGCEIN